MVRQVWSKGMGKGTMKCMWMKKLGSEKAGWIFV
tara:strand:+ start:1361 stop:1462 length:102 start_codon:yes stop_codon:yes gene_type:complete